MSHATSFYVPINLITVSSDTKRNQTTHREFFSRILTNASFLKGDQETYFSCSIAFKLLHTQILLLWAIYVTNICLY